MPQELPDSSANGLQDSQVFAELVKQLPDTSWGYLCALGFWAAQLFFIWSLQKQGIAPEALPDKLPPGTEWSTVPLLGMSVVCTIFYYFCIYRFHIVARATPGWEHPISAKRAVGFHFIPFYNFYWIFKWPLELGRFARWCMPNPGINWQFGLGYIATQLLVFADPALGVLAMFGLCGYVRWRLRICLEFKAALAGRAQAEAFSGQ